MNDIPPYDRLDSELGLAGLIERQLTRYINADRQVLPSSGLYGRIISEVERPLLRVVLNLAEGNKIKAAKILGLNRNTLLKKLREHGLDVPKQSVSKRARRADDRKREAA
jgi:two-component system nitrogen regulation response regulator GlnG